MWTSFYTKIGDAIVRITDWTGKLIAKTVASIATFASKVLSAIGFTTASKWMGVAATVAGFVGGGYERKDDKGNLISGWKPSAWAWFKVVRGVSHQVAGIFKNTKLAAYLGLLGLLEDFYGMKESIKGTKDGLGGEMHSLANDTKFKSFFNKLNDFFGISSSDTGIRKIFTRTLGAGKHLNGAFGKIRDAAPNL